MAFRLTRSIWLFHQRFLHVSEQNFFSFRPWGWMTGLLQCGQRRSVVATGVVSIGMLSTSEVSPFLRQNVLIVFFEMPSSAAISV